MKPRLFIASSVAHLDLAYAAQEGLEYDVECTVWNQGVFQPSRTAMSSLMDEVESSDFGLFVLAPDDVTRIRDSEKPTVRDNVIFELGLFIGRLGSERCFMIVPGNAPDLHLPTDLLGITPLGYPADRQDGNMVAALGPACSRIRKVIARLGKLASVAAPEIATTTPGLEDRASTWTPAPVSDPADCISLIQSWMGQRAHSDNQQVIRYDEVDRTLGLAPGSARKHIEEAAASYGYRPVRKGQDTILFGD